MPEALASSQNGSSFGLSEMSIARQLQRWSARVDGLGLSGEFVNGPRFLGYRTIKTGRCLREHFGSFVAYGFLLPRPASISTLGVPVVAICRNLDLLRGAFATQFIKVADREHLFLLSAG